MAPHPSCIRHDVLGEQRHLVHANRSQQICAGVVQVLPTALKDLGAISGCGSPLLENEINGWAPPPSLHPHPPTHKQNQIVLTRLYAQPHDQIDNAVSGIIQRRRLSEFANLNHAAFVGHLQT